MRENAIVLLLCSCSCSMHCHRRASKGRSTSTKSVVAATGLLSFLSGVDNSYPCDVYSTPTQESSGADLLKARTTIFYPTGTITSVRNRGLHTYQPPSR